jgi:hypothetical protein
MSLFSLRPLACHAVFVALVAYFSPLTARGDAITIQTGDLTVGATNTFSIAFNVDATSYFGRFPVASVRT